MALEITFWFAVGLLVYTHVGYPLVLAALRAVRGDGRSRAGGARREAEQSGVERDLPSVSLIIAAHDEEDVIERKLANVLALDYPRERLEVIVASDGSADRTVELAREGGADLVLDLPRGGKIAAQNAGAASAHGEILAFSDANAFWRPDAMRRLVGRFEDPGAGYVCGQVRYQGGTDGSSQEGLYWRYEMALRRLESDTGGVTGGNGGIYATRRESYLILEPSRSHDLSFPFEMVKRGWRVLYEPDAIAEERMVPTLLGEFGRKRRMMIGLWDIVIRDRMLDPRGYSPMYAFEIASHRLLRYLSPLLHLVALVANVALLGEGTIYVVTLAAQIGLLAAAALARFIPFAPFRLAAHYVSVTASIAAGLWDRLVRGTPGAWEKPEGTR
jgi:cellulose synthase/poly-beta-1,6-N-acetylglucosamine synthase-like glycosyltransferase